MDKAKEEKIKKLERELRRAITITEDYYDRWYNSKQYQIKIEIELTKLKSPGVANE